MGCMPFAKRPRQFLYEVPGVIIQMNAFLSENTHNDGFGGDIPEWIPIPLLSSLSAFVEDPLKLVVADRPVTAKHQKYAFPDAG